MELLSKIGKKSLKIKMEEIIKNFNLIVPNFQTGILQSGCDFPHQRFVRLGMGVTDESFHVFVL